MSITVAKPLLPAKRLAQIFQRTQTRIAMTAISGSRNRPQGLAAVFIIAAFLWTLALSVSPQLHERIHPDANRADHACAVTFIASGNYTHSAPPLLVIARSPVIQFSKIPTLIPQWVDSQFLGASIFEHAPPALA
jgi:hypothetical protein